MSKKEDLALLILDKVEGYKNASKYTDLTIQIESTTFKLHSLILASVSDYFDTMLSGNFKSPDPIILHDVDADAAEAIFNYCYTASIEINEANVANVLDVSERWLAKSVKKECAKFLIDTLNVDNCLDYLKLAFLYDLNDLRTKVLHVVSLHQKEICLGDKFKNLDTNQIVELLTTDKIVDGLKWTAIMEWIKIDCERLAEIDKLIKGIDITRVGSRQIKEMIEMFPSLKSNCTFMNATLNSLLSNKDHQAISLDPPLQKSEGNPVDVIFLSNVGKLTIYFPHIKRLYGVSMVPNTSFEMSTIGSDVYVVGNYNCDNGNTALYKYDIIENKWSKCTQLPKIYDSLAVCSKNGMLYFSGGGITGRKMCAFIPSSGRWINESIPTNRRSHRLIKSDEDDSLYVIGGTDFDFSNLPDVSSVKKIQSGTWKQVENMTCARANHGAVYFDGKIYVAGGQGAPQTAECYDIAADMWCKLPDMPYEMKQCALIKYKDGLLAIGCNCEPIEKYDIKQNKWSVFDDRKFRCLDAVSMTVEKSSIEKHFPFL